MAQRKNAFQEALENVKKLTFKAGANAGGAINNSVNYFNPNKGVVSKPKQLLSPVRGPQQIQQESYRNFWTDIPQVNAWNTINNIPKISLPDKINTRIKPLNNTVNPYLSNPVLKFGKPILEDVINTPINYPQGIMRATGGFIERKPQQVLGGAGQSVAAALNVLPLGHGAKVAKTAADITLKQALLRGAKTGAIYGGVQGLGKGLQEGISAKNVDKQLEEGAKGALVGALMGGTLGAGADVAGTAVGKTSLAVRNLGKKLDTIINEEFRGASGKLKQDIKDLVLRDARGRYAGRLKPRDPEVTYSGSSKDDIYKFKQTGERRLTRVDPTILDKVKNKFGLVVDDIFPKSKTSGAYGAALGLEPEKDDEGNIKGIGFNPERAALGFALTTGANSRYGQELREKVGNKIAGEIDNTPPSTQKYLAELVKKQQAAEKISIPGSVFKKGADFLSQVKSKIVDSSAPIEDVLSSAQKKYKYEVLPKNRVDLQIDRVLRAPVLAGQFAKDNGLDAVIREAPDLNALNQYMIAKQAKTVSNKGIETGRDLAKDEQLMKDLAPQYEQYAQKVNQYTRNLLQYSVDKGLISKDLQQKLIQEYPDYVPLNRVFNELEQQQLSGVTTRPVASLSRQSVVQKLKGSEREIINPLESILSKTVDAFNQGERNDAARMLASYKDLPGFEGLIKEGDGPHTFSYLDNGVKKTFSTTPEIAAAAKSLSQEQLGLVGKIFSGPTRVLQLGATGLNLPFLVTNLAKDQVTSFINGSNVARASLLNPINFGRALFSAAKHDRLYEEVVRNAAGGTSYDISRNAPKLAVDAIRSQRSKGARIKYLARNPGELLRSVEDIVGRGEEITRIQQYKGNRDAFASKGRTAQDSALLAAEAARNNTANFARKGDWGRVINGIIPFFNAGIQGARQLDRSFQNKPVATTAKVGLTIFMPVAIATAWNLSDPKRKQIYEDIDSFEKDSNLIIIPPGAEKDTRGSYNVIKIPIPPGLSNLSALIRRPMEQAQGLDPVGFGEVANNLFTATTSIDASSPSKIASTFTPQAVKPFVETASNTNLYTGKQIVPEYLKGNPASEQVKRYTSGTARGIGKLTNTSPLHIENAVRTIGGGVGGQLLNASDTLLNKAGVIPSEQVAGENPLQNLQRRFSKASGGSTLDKALSEQTITNAQTRTEAAKIYDRLSKLPRDEANEQASIIKRTDPVVFEKLRDIVNEKKLDRSYDESSMMQLGVENGSRARYIYGQALQLQTREERNAYINNLRKKKIISDTVLSQLKELIKKG